MAKGKAPSANQKLAYKQYADEDRYTKNRKMKLERHLKKYPNDEQAKKAMNNISYRRQPPRSRMKLWNRANREFAHQLRLRGLNGHAAIYHDVHPLTNRYEVYHQKLHVITKTIDKERNKLAGVF